MTIPRRLAPLLTALVLLAGCDGGLGFELGVPLAESRVEGNPLGGLLGELIEIPVPLDVDIAAETASRDAGPARAVRLTDLRLTITDTAEPPGDTDDFRFVEMVTVYVESRDPESTLPRMRIADARRPAVGARELVFRPTPDVDLLPYVEEGARLTASGSGEAPPDDVTFDGSVSLFVEL